MDKNLLLESLFNFSHINHSKGNYIILLLYSPIGILLVIIRILLLFLILLVIFLSPPSFIFPPWLVRLILPLFGIITRSNGYQAGYATFPIIASNHCTPFDVFPFLNFFNLNVLIDHGFFETSILARQFKKVVGAISIKRGNDPTIKMNDRDEILNHLKKSKKPFLFFPEGWDSNGKVGLMLYQKFLFSLGKPIIPVALKVRVLFLPLEASMLGTSLLKEVMWLFFYPFILFNLEFLSPQYLEREETDVQFAKRVQVITAKKLSIVPTNYSYKDALNLRMSIFKKRK